MYDPIVYPILYHNRFCLFWQKKLPFLVDGVASSRELEITKHVILNADGIIDCIRSTTYLGMLSVMKYECKDHVGLSVDV